LRDYVDYASSCTDANLAFHIAGGLICLSQTMPETLGIPLGGIPLYANLFALCVGPSTRSRKSAAVGTAENMLKRSEVAAIPETPGSAEGMLESIRTQERILFTYDEFGAFLAQTEKGYANQIKTLLTHAYDNKPLGRALANKQRGAIENPRVSVFGGSTVSFLERHTEPADWIGGFLARFLTFYTDRERTNELQPPDGVGGEKVVMKLQTLAGLDTFAGPCSGFTPAARSLWVKWYHESEKRADDSTHETVAAIYRAHAMAQKIALMLSWDRGEARTGLEWKINDEELTYAIGIVNMHIESVIEIGHKLASTKDLRDRNSVLECINGVPMTEGKIITRSKVGLKRRVREILDTLETEELIRRVSSQDGHTSLYMRVQERNGNSGNVVQLFNNTANGYDPDGAFLESVDDVVVGITDASSSIDLE